MPIEWKRAIIDAFADFPSVQFILKYDGDENDLVPMTNNVHLAKWIPQTDLLCCVFIELIE